VNQKSVLIDYDLSYCETFVGNFRRVEHGVEVLKNSYRKDAKVLAQSYDGFSFLLETFCSHNPQISLKKPSTCSHNSATSTLSRVSPTRLNEINRKREHGSPVACKLNNLINNHAAR
jgi:hypothetical protein